MNKVAVISLTILIFIASFIFGRSFTKTQVEVEKVSPKVAELKKEALKILGGDEKQVAKTGPIQEETKSALSSIKKEARYQIIATYAGVKSDHPLINTIIGLEKPKDVDHEAMVAIYKEYQDYLRNNPEKGFEEINNLLKTPLVKKDPALRGNLLIAASLIEGKEEEVKDLALKELEENIIPPESTDISVGRKVTTQPSKQGEDMAVVLAYNAFLSASMKDPKEVDYETIQILKKQTNKNVQKLLAISYDRAFPQNRAEMLNKLSEEGIKLFPDDFKVGPYEK